MKAILNLCCAASAACVIAFAVGFVEPSATKASAGETEEAFESHAGSKVVQYFDTYRADPLGLPAGCAREVQTRAIPVSWTNHEIDRGSMLAEGERSALVEAPAELVRVLPTRHTPIRYYLAGSNLVAVDNSFKVVDSIRIPTVRFE